MRTLLVSCAFWAASASAAISAPVLTLERANDITTRGAVIDSTPLPGTQDGLLLLRLFQGGVGIVEAGVRRRILQEVALTGPPGIDVDVKGAFSIATAPDFETSGKLYISLAAGLSGGQPGDPIGQNIVVEYTMDLQSRTIDPSTQRRIIAIDYPTDRASAHFGGALSFASDGTLFLTTGDGDTPFGAGADNPAQDVTSLLGKVLRIDVNGDDFQSDPFNNYSAPADNPDLGPTAAPEIFALGLRNPFKGKFDPDCECFLVADVGEEGFEEINVVTAGANFGWDAFEAELLIGGELADAGALTSPLFAYGRATGVSITGGLVYSGGKFAALQDRYIYGDFSGPAGATESPVFSFAFDAEANEVMDPVQYELSIDEGSLTQLVGFGENAGGDLFLFDFDGDIFKVASVQEVPLPATLVMFLLAIGALTRLARRDP